MPKHNSKDLTNLNNMLGHKLQRAPEYRGPIDHMGPVKIERPNMIESARYHNALKHREDLAFLNRAMKTFGGK